jgi:type VI protein secretion system component Hcp
MAEYGIMVGFKKIKGNSQLADFKEYIPAQACTFGSSSTRSGGNSPTKRHISIEQTPITVVLLAGQWVAEIQEACYGKEAVGDVIIAQLAQEVDKQSQAKPTVVQKLTLTNAIIVSVEQAWDTGDSDRFVNVTFMMEKILLEIDKKPADFTLRNFTAGAV